MVARAGVNRYLSPKIHQHGVRHCTPQLHNSSSLVDETGFAKPTVKDSNEPRRGLQSAREIAMNVRHKSQARQQDTNTAVEMSKKASSTTTLSYIASVLAPLPVDLIDTEKLSR